MTDRKRIRSRATDGRQPNYGACMTQDEVAAALGLSRARIQQIEESALRKLRNSARIVKVLKEFL